VTQTDALARGRGYNAERSSFRRRVEESRAPRDVLARSLQELPEFLGGLTVLTYLQILPGVGPTRARQLLRRVCIHDAEIRLRDLSHNERVVLAYVLRGK
jgi:hypothetical protein